MFSRCLQTDESSKKLENHFERTYSDISCRGAGFSGQSFIVESGIRQMSVSLIYFLLFSFSPNFFPALRLISSIFCLVP